jgi:hypothetical protein
MSLFTKKNNDKNILIFDIGSGSVGGALVNISEDKNKLPVILKTVRTEIIFQNEFNLKTLFADMLSALNFTAISLHRQKIGKVDGIYCVLASPWYFSRTRNIEYKSDELFLFTKKMADQLINKEISDLSKLYQEKYDNIKSESTVIEHHIMGISLNGYLTEDPFNKKAKIVDINSIVSVSPKLYLEKIKQTIFNNFSYEHIDVKFSSFIMDSYLAVRDRYNNISSYLLIDISGQVTDIGIVYKNALKYSLSFPFGKKSFFNYICTKLEIELRDAEELFKLYSTNNISESYRKKVEPLFKSIENSWGEAFRQCIDVLPRTFIIPNTIFLTADNDIKDWFSKMVCEKSTLDEIDSNKQCTVYSLSGNEFISMCNVKEGTCDPFLMMESIATAKKI